MMTVKLENNRRDDRRNDGHENGLSRLNRLNKLSGLSLHAQMNQDFGSVNDRAIDDKAAKELARAVYAELRSEGCLAGDMISVSSLLISLITAEIRHSD